MSNSIRERSTERRLEAGTVNDGVLEDQDDQVGRPSRWILVHAIVQLLLSMFVGTLSFVSTLGLWPARNQDVGGSFFSIIVQRYLANPGNLLDDARLVIRGMFTTVDVLDHVFQDGAAIAILLQSLRTNAARQRRP